MARKVELDTESLTNGEIEMFEDHARITFNRLGELIPDRVSEVPHRALTALLFIGLRRTDPHAMLSEVQNAQVGDFELELVGGEPSDPLPEPSTSDARDSAASATPDAG